MVGLGTKFSMKSVKKTMDNLQFVTELAKLRSASTFLTLKGYKNEASEVADYNIVFHMSYENALKKSLEVLSNFTTTTDLEKLAKLDLMSSFAKSLGKMANIPVEEIDDAYTRFFDDDGDYIKGVKMHTATGTLHLYGLVVNKKVYMPGMYTKTNKKPLTIAKDKLRYLTPVGKFRQFKITSSQVDSISVENLSLLPPA
jgi:hypothetical protein